ncbi:MAG: GNAT family N-acetyltransferase [Thalassovita sp.]
MTPERLADLHARAFTRQRPWSADEFASLLTSPTVFLVHDDHAFALGRVIVDEAELLTLATAPNHQRKGLGRQMLTRFHDSARTLGATRAFLEAAADNTPALTLYQAENYVQDGRRPAYYRMSDGQTVDAVIMSRALPLG